MPILPTGTLNREVLDLSESDISAGGQAGFTLVELLVVIVVLALSASLVLPLLDDSGSAEKKQKIRRISGTVRQLYNEATLTRDEFQLTLDFERNRLEAYRLNDVGNKIEREEFGKPLNLEPLYLRQADISGQGSFQAGRVTLTFYPIGWIDATELVLDDNDGHRFELAFSPLTGTVTIDEDTALQR